MGNRAGVLAAVVWCCLGESRRGRTRPLSIPGKRDSLNWRERFR